MNVMESIFDENIPLMMEKSKEEPVFILGEDEPKYVLLSFEDYKNNVVPLIRPLNSVL